MKKAFITFIITIALMFTATAETIRLLPQCGNQPEFLEKVTLRKNLVQVKGKSTHNIEVATMPCNYTIIYQYEEDGKEYFDILSIFAGKPIVAGVYTVEENK